MLALLMGLIIYVMECSLDAYCRAVAGLVHNAMHSLASLYALQCIAFCTSC